MLLYTSYLVSTYALNKVIKYTTTVTPKDKIMIERFDFISSSSGIDNVT